MHTFDGLGNFMSVPKSEHEGEDLNLICMILWGFLGQVNSEPFRSLQATYRKRAQ